jgi:hypothetical protein
MTKRLRVMITVLLLLLLAPTIAASADTTPTPSASPTSAPAATAFPAHGPPTTMLGLTVKKEDIAKKLAGETRALYVDRVALYSLRDPTNLLEATVEIGHFRGGTQWASTDFQMQIAQGLGSSLPVLVRLGSTVVYLTSSKGLSLAIWYDQGYMFVLAIRSTFKQPKELLRQSLAINP